MSEYIGHYREELLRLGHSVATERMYFWAAKPTAFRWFTLRRRLREGFDAVIIQHTPTASGPFLGVFLKAARRLGLLAVVVGHEPPSVYAKHLPGLLKPLYRAYERRIFETAGLAIVHTRQHRQQLLDLGCRKPIEVLPIPVYGIDAAKPAHLPRDAWGYYGMISPKKGVDLLLNAYQQRPAGTYPDLLLMGGAAPGHEAYVDSLRASVRPEYRSAIRFLGYLDAQALAEAMARIQLMIFPYRWVSQSAALAQTCYQGIPYLATDLPYFRDFFETYGCGRLFAPEAAQGEAPALVEALDRAAKEPPLTEGQAFEDLKQALNLTQCARRLVHLLTEKTKIHDAA